MALLSVTVNGTSMLSVWKKKGGRIGWNCNLARGTGKTCITCKDPGKGK